MAKLNLSTDQLKRIHMALEQSEGRLSPAAALLNISRDSLKKIVGQYPELSSYLDGAKPPTDAETIARPALPPTNEETDIVAAVKAGDTQIQQGFDSIGITGTSLSEAVAFAQFGRQHFGTMREFISGGVCKLFSDLVGDVKKLREEIEDPAIKVDVDMQRMLREDRSRLLKLALECYDRTRQAAYDAAAIEAKRAEARNGKKKAAPAFAPLAVKCDTLVVNEQPKQPSSQPEGSPASPSREGSPLRAV